MPKVSGYVRFKKGPPIDTIPNWSVAGFCKTVGYPRSNSAWITMSPDEKVALQTYSDGNEYLSTWYSGLKRDVAYPFTLEYTVGGTVNAEINGVHFNPLPAPKTEQPFNIFNADYYQNWWDVPEYKIQAAATGIGAAISGVAGYVLKPLDPVISALIGAGLGGGAGYGLAYLATTGIPEIPIPTFGAAPEESGAPMRLGKYQITG